MVKIASPFPDCPASPLFRKLASENDKQKASSADKVIMAIKLRQKRTAQDANTETGSPIAPSDVRSESKRRKLESASGKDIAGSDMDMDLDPMPRRKHTDRVFRPSRYGITSPTPRNPIVSSFSSSRKSQSTLKRRMDTSSIEVEEEEGVSPIKKKAHPQGSQQSPGLQSPSKRINANQPRTPGFSSVRSGGRALYLEKNTGLPATGSPSKEAGTTPQKSSLKGKLFTPKRTPCAPRVDTPGEYTAADNKEDRAQARQRGSYLKEMLMQDTEESTSTGADSTVSAPKTNALFTGAAATTTTTTASNPLTTFSIGSLPKSTASTTSAAPSVLSTTATTSSGGTPALGILSTSVQKTSDNPLLSSSDKQKLTATSSEKTVKFGNPAAAQLNLSSSASAAASVGTTQKSGETALGFKLPSAPSTGNGLLNIQATQPSFTLGANPLGTSLSSALGGTQVDAKAQSLSANNNAVTSSSAGAGGLVKTAHPGTLSAPISGGFTASGAATPMFGGFSTTAAPATSTLTTTSSTKTQFAPAFGGQGAASGVQSSAGTTPGKPSSQAQAGGFQFGQTFGGSTSIPAGGLSFGNTKTSSVPSGLATPFQAAAQTSAPASTVNKQISSMPAPNTTAPSAKQGGGPQFPPIFGQQAPTKPAGANGPGQGGPSFGSNTSQPSAGGFTFGQAVSSATTAAAPPAFNFGGSTAAPTSSTSSSSSVFSSAPATPFGVSKPASAVGSSLFGSTPAQNQTSLGGATTNTTTMFGGAKATPQKPAFGATNNTSMFGVGSTPGATSAPKPAFGNPTAMVTPFGSSQSQLPPPAAASPFQFGSSQPKAPTQPAATGGFNFGGQANPQKNVGFGASAPAPASNNGFQFGQTQPSSGAAPQSNFFGGAAGASAPAPASNNGFQFGQTQPSSGAAPQSNFFGGAAANTASPFGGGGGGFGTPAPSSGNTPAPAFGASPSPAAAPGATGFSVGTGGTNPASNQRRMNRLKQVRNRASRR